MNARSLTVTASDSPRGRRVLLAALAALALACATALAGPAPALAAACPNEALRAEARSTQLAQCRAYEMVSPVDTADSGVQFFFGAAPNGEAAEFASVGGFAGPHSNYGFNIYIARRGNEDWQSSSVGIPATLGAVVSGFTTSFDLTKQWVRVEFLTGERAGYDGLVLSENLAAAPALSFEEVAEYRNIPEALSKFNNGHEGHFEPEDESPDFSHIVVPSNISESFIEPKLYEISDPGGPTEALQLVSIDPEGKPINAVVGRGKEHSGSLFHAISNDGAEIFFTTYGGSNVSYVRVNGSTTLELGGGLFQGASEDGSKVFLRDAGYKLYMDEIGREPGHVEVTKTVPISGTSYGFYVRSSDDGSHVYFVSNGVLAPNENENKETASATAWNLYVYDTVTKGYAFIAQAEPGGELFANILPGIHVEAQVNGCPSIELGETEEPGCEDGRFFVFTSTARITPGDTASAKQVFEYDAKTGHLARVSTGEGGYADNGNSNALGASIAPAEFGEPGLEAQMGLFEDSTRAVSDDGSTVVFSSSGALSPRAVNDLQPQPGPEDIYESHEGQVSLLSTGHSLTSDEQPTITPSGRDVFFTSTENILPQDSDGLKSLYDARVGGGFPAAPVPAGGCNGDSCQGPPSVPNLLAASGSATFSGLGNPAPAASTPAVKPKTKAKPKKCKKGYVRKKGRCVKKPKAKKAGNDRRIKR